MGATTYELDSSHVPMLWAIYKQSTPANKARGIVRAAAYSANINDAGVGTDPAGSRYCGRMIPTMEKPLATRTLIAVTTEASRIAFIVVIDSSQSKLGRA